MGKQKSCARLTIDLSPELHRKLKSRCAVIGKSMRDILIEAIEEKVQFLDIQESKELNK